MKNRISHIVSCDLLDKIDNRDFYMCLANIVIKDDTYKQFYIDRKNEGCFILLDNGAAEGEQLTREQMIEVINTINPDEVILNDILRDCDKTIKDSIQSAEYYRNNGYTGRFMFVVQGMSVQECIDCYNKMDKQYIDTIGIPKHINKTSNDKDARLKICKELDKYNKPIHLLGCAESMYEVKNVIDECENVRSCDTALAFIYSLNYEYIDTKHNRPLGKINFINSHFNHLQKFILSKNIEVFDNLLKT